MIQIGSTGNFLKISTLPKSLKTLSLSSHSKDIEFPDILPEKLKKVTFFPHNFNPNPKFVDVVKNNSHVNFC